MQLVPPTKTALPRRGCWTKGSLRAAILEAFGTHPLSVGCEALNIYLYIGSTKLFVCFVFSWAKRDSCVTPTCYPSYGSHLHGCARPTSNYDFVVVVVSALSFFSGIHHVSFHTTNVLPMCGTKATEVELNLNVYHQDYFWFVLLL